MNIIPTLEGGLCIEIEYPDEWLLLQSIPNDAIQRDESLASELGSLITEPQLAEDWQDYVLPELEHEFNEAIKHVTTTLDDAHHRHHGGIGRILIAPGDANLWFSALNQARLALEGRYHFGSQNHIDPEMLPVAARDAMLRSQLYCAIQSMILENIMQ